MSSLRFPLLFYQHNDEKSQLSQAQLHTLIKNFFWEPQHLYYKLALVVIQLENINSYFKKKKKKEKDSVLPN